VSGASARSGSRDAQDVDALVTDRYLESILAAHARGADRAPVAADVQPPMAIRLAVQRLTTDLPRYHPSFRFEEALAGKLSLAAARMRVPLASGGSSLEIPIALPELPLVPVRRSDLGFVRMRRDGPIEVGRPLLIGGAITSAAISLAGAAYVAWRIRHPQASPMVRAARAVARTRLA
jgi:hypothetical protein